MTEDNDIVPLWHRTKELDELMNPEEALPPIWSKEQETKIALKVIRRYVKSEMDLKCYNCHFADGYWNIDEEIDSTCIFTGDKIKDDDVCAKFTPYDKTYELWVGYGKEPMEE